MTAPSNAVKTCGPLLKFWSPCGKAYAAGPAGLPASKSSDIFPAHSIPAPAGEWWGRGQIFLSMRLDG